MALNKVIYVDDETVITAENLNEIQDAIIALEESPVQGLTEDLKQAMLQIARKVAYIDDQGQTYYDDLYDALYPPKTVVSITAVFEQGSTVIYDNTALNDLKQYLTVTARYDDNTTAILSDSAYSLSGLLEAPSSTVTVLYNGVSTTFSVAVTARPTLSSITADYTQPGTVYDTDTLDSLKDDLVVTAHYSDSSTQTVPAADYTLSGTLTAGTSTITVSYGGKTDTFDVTVSAYYLYYYSMSNGQIVKIVGATSGAVPNHAGVIELDKTSSNRRSFPTLRTGVKPYSSKSEGYANTEYYPIPIPPDAVKAVVSIEPSTQFTGSSFYTYSPSDGYTRRLNPGWKLGSFTYSFTAGQYAYMTIASKYNSAGSSYPTEPTEVSLQFLTE